MENKTNDNKSLTTFIPMIMVALATVLIITYMGGDKPKEQQKPQQQMPQQKEAPDTRADFTYQVGETKQYNIDTDYYHIILSEKGGRIARLYLKSTDELNLPASVIKEEKDPVATQYKAIEATRGNGLDFQPHLYFSTVDGLSLKQISLPLLNDAAFTLESQTKNSAGNIEEIRFKLPLEIKGHKLEIVKIYRFFKHEYYFRQTTVIRNLEQKEFVWGGDLYFKSASDIGPPPRSKSNAELATYSRFFYYNGSMNQHQAFASGAGCSIPGIPGCGAKGQSHGNYTVYLDHPDTLEFEGSMSRYFINYTKYLSAPNAKQVKPDGVILSNHPDPTGRETGTVQFRDFRLSPAASPEIDLGDVNASGNSVRLQKTQERTDLLVIDSMNYYGVRRDESHTFRDTNLAKAEFGMAEPDSHARDVLYSSGFLALFSYVRDGIVWLMRFFYKFIGNYGWVIIILAILFKIVTWPLNQMQAKSMKRMHEIKPELDKINDKYKDNPQEKQRRTMELYKKNNVNPAKGCFPILIQIPIFIALYSAFSDSVELWRSPFILWMTDLSAPDTVLTIPDLYVIKDVTLNILPLVMVASQLLQQKLTTVVTDPQQQMMMYIMPVIMIFFFWTMPSGVTLYWTIQNIISIIWQLIVDRYSPSSKVKKA